MQFSSCGKGNWNNSKLGWKWFEFKLFFFLWKLFLFFFIFRDLLRSGSSLTILINLDFSNRLKGKGFELFVSGVDTLDFAWSRVWKWRQDYAHQIVKWKWLFHSSLFFVSSEAKRISNSSLFWSLNTFQPSEKERKSLFCRVPGTLRKCTIPRVWHWKMKNFC